MGLIPRRAFAAAGRGGFALAAAATIVSISARHSFSPVASSSRIAGMREKTHSRKAIRKLGTEYIVDLVDGHRRYPSPLTIAKPPCNPRATAFALRPCGAAAASLPRHRYAFDGGGQGGFAAQPESHFRLECRRNARTAEQLRPSLVTM